MQEDNGCKILPKVVDAQKMIWKHRLPYPVLSGCMVFSVYFRMNRSGLLRASEKAVGSMGLGDTLGCGEGWLYIGWYSV